MSARPIFALLSDYHTDFHSSSLTYILPIIYEDSLFSTISPIFVTTSFLKDSCFGQGEMDLIIVFSYILLMAENVTSLYDYWPIAILFWRIACYFNYTIYLLMGILLSQLL